MNIDLETIEKSIETADGLCSKLKKIEEDLGRLSKEVPDKFEEIKIAYFARIASQQSSILSTFRSFSQWKTIETFLQKSEKFAKDTEDAILNPERTELLGLFERWVKSIGVTWTAKVEAWIKNCLGTANKDLLAGVKVKINEIVEGSNWLKGSLLEQMRHAVENEMDNLTKLDKTQPQNIVGWVHKAESAISQGLSLMGTRDNIKKEQASKPYSETPALEIVQQFNVLVDGLTRPRISKDGVDFDKVLQHWSIATSDIQNEWLRLMPKCNVFKGQYGQLPEHAKELAKKEISAWKAEKLQDICELLDNLGESVGKVMEAKSILDDIEADWSSLDELDKNADVNTSKPLLQELSSIHLSASELMAKTSLKEYIEGLNELEDTYNAWLKKLNEAKSVWVNEAKSWMGVCTRRALITLDNLQKELSELEKLDAKSDTVGSIVRNYLKVKGVIQDTRRLLLESLEPEKLRLLEMVMKVEAERGEVLITDLKKKLGKLEQTDLNNIVSLAIEDGLLTLKIST